MAKTIITAALCGAVTPKAKCPALPVTPKEIAEDGIRAWKAGASVLHLHMRDDNGFGTMDVNKFRECVNILRGECDAVLNLTSSGELNIPDEKRWEHIVELKPELGTFDCGSLNTGDGVFENKHEFLLKLANIMMENGVKPEVEIMDFGMLNACKWMADKGILAKPVHYQFVLGFGLYGSPATPKVLCDMVDQMPAGSTWSAFGTGTGHMPILHTAIALGGNVRVGLEDNIWYAKGVPATNEMLVARAARVIKEYGNEVATPADAREILGLNK